MSDSVLSLSTLMVAKEDGIVPSVHLKRAAILADRIIFHPHGLGPRSLMEECFGPVPQMMARLAATSEDEYARLKKDGHFADTFINAEDLTENGDDLYPKPDEYSVDTGALVEWAKPLLRRQLGLSDTEYTRELHEALKDLPYRIAADFAAFRCVQRYVPTAFGMQSDLYVRALTHVGAARGAQAAERTTVCRGLEDLGLPDFGELNWPEILELRRDPSANAFRAQVSSMAVRVSAGELGVEDVSREALKELWSLARSVRPKIGSSVFSGLLGNLPLPLPVNPVSLFTAAADVRAQVKRQEDFGWLFFVARSQALSPS